MAEVSASTENAEVAVVEMQENNTDQEETLNGAHGDIEEDITEAESEPSETPVPVVVQSEEPDSGPGSVGEPDVVDGDGIQARMKKRKLTMDESEVEIPYERLCQEIVKANERLMEYLVEKTELIEDVEKARAIIDEMITSAAPVSVDCEGVNLGDRRSGKVTLVQIGDMNQKAFLFDVQATPELAKEVKKLLEAENIIKVMHDCRGDSEGLYSQFGIHVKNVFDTQSAHVVIQKGNGKYTNADKNVSLDQVCNDYGGAGNPFKDKIKGVYRKDQRFWTRRPLTAQMTSYAASDVLCLLPTVYNELNRQISSEADKKLLAELSNEQISQTRSKHSSSSHGSHSKSRNSYHHRNHQHQYYPSRRGRGRGTGYY